MDPSLSHLGAQRPARSLTPSQAIRTTRTARTLFEKLKSRSSLTGKTLGEVLSTWGAKRTASAQMGFDFGVSA